MKTRILCMALAAAFAASPLLAEEKGAAGESADAAAANRATLARLETERLMREEAAAAKRRAEEDRQAVLRTKAIERDRSCVIKPVMGDDEIERCKWAWSVPPPG